MIVGEENSVKTFTLNDQIGCLGGRWKELKKKERREEKGREEREERRREEREEIESRLNGCYL